MQKKLIFFIMVVSMMKGFSQTNHWKKLAKSPSKGINLKRAKNLPDKILFQLDFEQFKKSLKQSARERSKAKSSNLIMQFPNAQGKMETFKIAENAVLSPDLSAKFPGIKSYIGIAVNNSSSVIHFSISPKGLNAMRLSVGTNDVFIEPYGNKETYSVFTRAQKEEEKPNFKCNTKAVSHKKGQKRSKNSARNADDGILRTYDIAVVASDEYYAHHTAGERGTAAQLEAIVVGAINTSLTRVNGIYERDFAIHLNLTFTRVFTNSRLNPDPFSFNDDPNTVRSLRELTSIFENARVNGARIQYDFGHLFGAGDDSGFAPGEVCNGANVNNIDHKSKAFTLGVNPEGDVFDVDFLAHEIGHQFGANHTWTSRRNERTGVQMEPGSGSTIMGYAGLEGARNVQLNSDPYFHAASIEQVTNFIGGTACDVETRTRNNTPQADAGNNFVIPRGTAFVLEGEGQDRDANDRLTYTWEQMDSGDNTSTVPSVNRNVGPAFRSFAPSISNKRYFPRLSTVKQGNTSWRWEAVPNVSRTMNFRFTVRDNRAGGGANNSDNMTVRTVATAGPFVVTAPNATGIQWEVGSQETVRWNVAGTTRNGINARTVDIFLMVDETEIDDENNDGIDDDGQSFDLISLASNVTNDGSHTITVPDNVGTGNRIMVKGHNNIFFDLSNEDFEIIEGNNAACTNVNFSLTLDEFPNETSWSIINTGTGAEIESVASFRSADQSTTKVTELCLENGSYRLTINDSIGDGICCSFGNGSYTLSVNGVSQAQGGNFARQEVVNFVIGNNAAKTGKVKEAVITDAEKETKVKLYPNPLTGDELKIIATKKASYYVIHDVTGRLVKQGNVNNKRINLASLSTGTYLITLDFNGEKEVQRLLVN
ncbi:zinc-dependent metalloprotease [Tenacibaculum sp. 190524A02b]|uniref:zinc-dependent metalloprotease n=1 Tax=Tenacibaculum vairaonense TaxID=3137860 RepID=UPI0032B11FB0